ncbi:MAG: chemotaxis protein [Butyrivibrio sp.]|nr:chemotaxis protein [Butyrivibrio sp.]
MPKGNPNKNTIRVERYQKKEGYKVKGFKLKGDVAERFEEACKAAGVSQAAKITELMEEFIKSVATSQQEEEHLKTSK